MKDIETMRALLLHQVGRKQMATALEAAVFAFTEGYLKAHPDLTRGLTDGERYALQCTFIVETVYLVLNTAAEVLIKQSTPAVPSQEAQDNAADVAAAAIAKASGKLN